MPGQSRKYLLKWQILNTPHRYLNIIEISKFQGVFKYRLEISATTVFKQYLTTYVRRETVWCHTVYDNNGQSLSVPLTYGNALGGGGRQVPLTTLRDLFCPLHTMINYSRTTAACISANDDSMTPAWKLINDRSSIHYRCGESLHLQCNRWFTKVNRPICTVQHHLDVHREFSYRRGYLANKFIRICHA